MSEKMKLKVSTFWLASIIVSGLASLTTLTDLDRELPYIIPQSKSNCTYDDGLRHHLSYRREIPRRFEHQRSQTIDFKADDTYLNQERAKKNNPALNGNENNTTVKIFTTYGKGNARVKQGQTVNVPNKVGRNSNKTPMPAKMLRMRENEIKPVRHQRACKECPTDQTVIAVKGNQFALLPEPCPPNPKMWIHHSGPRPGSKIPEGVHLIRGYIGPHKKFCEYHYGVSVRHCEPLNVKEDTIIECSAENSWGSICNVSCGIEKEPIGPTELECKEDLTWSHSVPQCKGKNDCSTPKVKTNSKISCQTANMTQVEEDFKPNGSTCKFLQNKKEVSINCKDGKWRIIRKSKTLSTKKKKQKTNNKTNHSNACNPNPCQNGGTCMKPESSKGPPICKCRPQTRGIHCEMRECYYNICENDGLCFFQNEERTCYCASDYSGDTCQHYTPQ